MWLTSLIPHLTQKESSSPAGPPELSDFLRHISLERSLSVNTCLAYQRDVREYLGYLSKHSISVAQASQNAISDFLWDLKSRKGVKPATIQRKIGSLRAFYRFLVGEGRMEASPAKEIRGPRLPKKIPRFLSLQEIEKLFDLTAWGPFEKSRLKAMLELLYATGMRVSELVKLRLENFNLEQGWVRVMGKGAKERMIPVHSRAVAALKRYMDIRQGRFSKKIPAGEIFLNRLGTGLSRVQFWRDLKALGKKAGIESAIFPHILRHTFASHLLQGGADLRAIQEMLGHADLSTTEIYTHIEKSGLKEAHRKHHPREGNA